MLMPCENYIRGDNSVINRDSTNKLLYKYICCQFTCLIMLQENESGDPLFFFFVPESILIMLSSHVLS